VNLTAERALYGIGAPPSTGRYLTILRNAANAGNLPAIKSLIRTYRLGVPRKIGQNLTKARGLISQFATVLGDDRRDIELALLRLAQLRSANDYSKALNDPAFSAMMKRTDVQYDITATNKNFQVFRLQNKFQASGMYSGPKNGLLNKATIQAIISTCKKQNLGKACPAPVVTPVYIQTLVTN
jgi:uncharacterized protein